MRTTRQRLLSRRLAQLYPDYLKNRAQDMSPRQAFTYASDTTHTVPGLDWEWDRDDQPRATFSPAVGYVAYVQKVEDRNPDLSFLGEWSSAGDFVPAISERSHYEDLRAKFYGRTQARELARQYVRQDAARMEDYGKGWFMVGLILTIEAADAPGVTLAQGSLWGIESDAGDNHFREVAADLLYDALPAARAEAQRLAHVFTDTAGHVAEPPANGGR